MKDNNGDIRDAVRDRYAKAITGKTGCCSSTGCCGGTAEATNAITGNLYTDGEITGLPSEALAASLGCGNPTALTPLHPGETVLDLGSGAGLDVLLSARRVSPGGKAYGLDMTPEMLAAAEANKAKAGAKNAEFLYGHIENIPLPDNEVDVVISNCVINLSADKDQVFREIIRVLKPGGRLAVSDIVVTRPLPEKIRRNVLAWAGCMAGALSESEYRNKLAAAGFHNIELVVTRVYDLARHADKILPDLSPEELTAVNGSIVSAFIRAKKPAKPLIPGADFTIRPARAGDLAAITALLSASGLITSGVAETLDSYLVALSDEIAGVIGSIRSADTVMLRSFAVDSRHRKTGLASALLREALRQAKAAGVKEACLYTSTAETYFARHGFKVIQPEEIPADLAALPGLSACCHAGCTAMRLKL